MFKLILYLISSFNLIYKYKYIYGFIIRSRNELVNKKRDDVVSRAARNTKLFKPEKQVLLLLCIRLDLFHHLRDDARA